MRCCIFFFLFIYYYYFPSVLLQLLSIRIYTRSGVTVVGDEAEKNGKNEDLHAQVYYSSSWYL